MGFFNGLRPDTIKGQPELARQSVDEKSNAPTILPTGQSEHIKSVAAEDFDNDELVHTDMQTGVQKIEGMAQVWPRWTLYLTYTWYVPSSYLESC
jgi:hypothetical protein